MADGLTFNELRRANIERCEGSWHPIAEWTPTDWACAAAGEMGEACNFIKKLRRGEDISMETIGKELADTVTYLDLLAERLGINLGDAVRSKFNEVSLRIGSEVTL